MCIFQLDLSPTEASLLLHYYYCCINDNYVYVSREGMVVENLSDIDKYAWISSVPVSSDPIATARDLKDDIVSKIDPNKVSYI